MVAKNFQVLIVPNPAIADIMSIHFKGNVDQGSIGEIAQCFDTIVGANKNYAIADLSGVEDFSSAALGELMGGRKRLIENGGDLVLAGMTLEIKTKFSLLGANKIFKVYHDERTAINAYTWEHKNKAEDVRLTFPSNLKFVPPVRQLVSRIVKQKGYGNRDSFRIETIIDEICNNAVEHGIQDANPDIDLKLKIDREKIEINVINISDPKKIASLQALLQPVRENNIQKLSEKRGRGLALIKMLSNDLAVDISDKGTSVHVTKIREE